MAQSSQGCALCLEQELSRALVTKKCSHKFCGKCIAAHVSKGRRLGVVKCPICRHRVREITVADAADIAFKISYRGVVFNLDIRLGESLDQRLNDLFSFLPGTLRVIGKGQRATSLDEVLLEHEPNRKWVHKVYGTVKGQEVVAPTQNVGFRERVLSKLSWCGAWAIAALKESLAATVLFFRTLNPLNTLVEDYESQRVEDERARERERHLHAN